MINFLRRWLVGIVIAVVFFSAVIFLGWLMQVAPVIAGILILVLMGLAFADFTD